MSPQEKPASLQEQLSLSDSKWRSFRRELEGHSLASCAAAAGGLLTQPDFATYAVRLESFAHLAAAHARGHHRVSEKTALRWLDEVLAASAAHWKEDPPEDVFVSCVYTSSGNYRIFPGMWESSHFHLQRLLDALFLHSPSSAWSSVIQPVVQLLRLSEAIAERAEVQRWDPPGLPSAQRAFGSLHGFRYFARRVSFSDAHLADLRIRREDLSPFILPEADWGQLDHALIEESPLTYQPLLDVGDHIICVLPSAISVAACRYVLARAAADNRLDELASGLRSAHAALLFGELIPRLQSEGTAGPDPTKVLDEDEYVTLVELPIDVDTVALISVFYDDLAEIRAEGFNSRMRVSRERQHALLSLAEKRVKEGKSVLACAATAGLGRGFAMDAPPQSSTFHHFGITVADLEIFASVEGLTFLRFLKLLQHAESLAKQGVTVSNLSGPLNLLAFWKSQGFTLVLDRMFLSKNHTLLSIPPDCLRDFRLESRVNVDRHAVPIREEAGTWVPVQRLRQDPVLRSHAHRPVYLVSEAVATGQLRGLVKGPNHDVWIVADPYKLPVALYGLLYRIWEALLNWLDRAGSRLPSRKWHVQATVVSIRLEDPMRWKAALEGTSNLAPESPSAELKFDHIMLRVPPGFVPLLDRAENDAERSLLSVVVEALIRRNAESSPETAARAAAEIVRDVMRDPLAREIHLVRGSEPADTLPAPGGGLPRMIQPEDLAESRLGLGWACTDPSRQGKVLEGEAAQTLLHACVEELWREVRHCLADLDQVALITMVMRNVEALWRERRQSRLTAAAVLGLAEGQREALEAVSARNQQRLSASLSNRVLIEMGAATARRKGGRPPQWATIDHLLGRVGHLIELASHSDAIRGHVAAPVVRITPAGRVGFDRSYIQSLLEPYYRRQSDEEYLRDARAYAEHRATEGRGQNLEWLTSDFEEVFESEFGLSVNDLFEVVGGLLDLANEEGALVVKTDAIRLGRWVESTHAVSSETVAHAMRYLTLRYRGQWNRTPNGYAASDWWPWRFRRRLSLSMAPLAALGNADDDPIIFGVNQLIISTGYRLSGLQDGVFPVGHFTSSAMKSYVGETRHRIGRAFEEEVSGRLRSLGWNTETNVEMSSLGAPKRLGDIDVLAWRPEGTELYVIECKSLIPRGTTYELVEELRAFRGKANDRLGKHLSRVEWLRDNRELLATARADIPGHARIVPMFVTNRDVPMRYRDDLPFPPERFQTVEELAKTMSVR